MKKNLLLLAILSAATSVNAVPMLPLSLDAISSVKQGPLEGALSGADYIFTDTGSGTVNYLQLCQVAVNGTGCFSACTGQYTTINNGSPLDASGSKTYNFSDAFFKSYLALNGIITPDTSGNYCVRIYAQSTGYDCNSFSQNCSASVDSSGAPLTVFLTYDGTNVTSATQQSSSSVSLSNPAPQYLFVPEQQSSPATVAYCTLNSFGGILSCNPDTPDNNGAWGQPSGVAVTNIGGSEYLYVADVRYTDPAVTPSIVSCTINSDGTISGCAANGVGTFTAPTSVGVATMDGVQHIFVGDTHTVFQCELQPGGAIVGPCTPFFPSTGQDPVVPGVPQGFAFLTSADLTQYMYFADSTGEVYQCDSSFSCTPVSVDFSDTTPYSIAFANFTTPDNSATYAYVATGTDILMCGVDSSGDFTSASSSCPSAMVSPPSSNWAPEQISVVNVAGNQYAYVSSTSSSTSYLYVCMIAPEDSAFPEALTQGQIHDCTPYNANTAPAGAAAINVPQ